MNKNKLKAVIVSSAVLTGAMINNSSIALADDLSTNPKDSNDNIDVNHDVSERSTPVINGIRVNKALIDINYSKGVTIVPKYIVIHDTDNRSATANAMANRNYFANHPNANASAHYIVDDSNIVQALEDTWKGWHVGDGGASSSIQNGNSIGIELAVNADGNFDKTYKTGIELTRYLMRKHNIPAQNVVMHNHASGKICSKMMIQDRPNMWEEFKYGAASGMPGESFVNDGVKPIAKGRLVNVNSYLSVRTSPNSSSAVLGNVYPKRIMNIYGQENGYYKVDFMGTKKTYGYVSENYIQLVDGDVSGGGSTGDNNGNNAGGNTNEGTPINKDGVVVNLSSGSELNVRKGPSTGHEVLDRLKIDSKVKVNYEKDGWYNISYGNGKTGFVSKTYINILSSGSGSGENSNSNTPINKDGVVTNINASSSLNVRSGAGTNYSIQDTIAANTKVKVNYKTTTGWYNIGYSGKIGFVSADYIKITETENSGGSNSGESNSGGSSSGGSNATDNTPVNRDGVVGNLGSTSVLNVRSGASTNHGIQDKLSANTQVRVNYKTNTGWYNISYSGKTGFASSDYINLVEDSNNNNINKKGTVVGVSSSLNVRTGPSTSYSIKDQIAKGKVVKVNYEKDGWYNITYDGEIGYVSKSYISLSESDSSGSGSNSGSGNTTEKPDVNKKTGSVYNVSSALNVRSGAGSGYSVLGTLKANDKVIINHEINGWYNIDFNGKTGFVSTSYIKLDASNSVTSQKGKVINIETNLNVRSGMGTNYSIIGYLLGDSIVTILDHKNGWYKIGFDTSNGEKIGYVKDEYIKKI